MGVEADLQPSGCWFGKFTQEYCCGDIDKGEEQGSRVLGSSRHDHINPEMA